MRDVVDAGDHHAAVALLDQADGRVLDLEGEKSTAQAADDAVKLFASTSGTDADWIVKLIVLLSIALGFGLIALGIWAWAAFLIVSGVYVLFAVLVLGIAYLKLRRLSGLKKTRETVSEGLGILGRDLFGGAAFPLAEVDLSQARARLGRGADDFANELCGLEGALQVARVEPREMAAGQARGEKLGLTAAVLRKRRIELALDSVLLVPRRLAVADEHEARGRGPSGKW